MDGHGVSPFLTRILEQYCNLRYGTAFANTPIVCSPAYDIEAMMEKYPSPTATESTMQRDVVQTYEGRMRRALWTGQWRTASSPLRRWPVC